MKKYLVALLLLANLTIVSAQNSDNKVLFTIDNQPFYTDEFVRVYNKNLDLVKDDSQKDLNTYLDLFIGYKLKVEKAKKLGLQNKETYINELSSYRNQLAKNYVNDSKVTDALIKEAYDRTITEIRASHILIMLPEGAEPKDTLAAYNKMVDLTKRIAGGESFEDVAMKYSEDPSAKMNKGDLGYFTAFKMVYPFENAAYTTEIGKISNIFKTRFGYHILKVTDKRKNRGDVIVKHIMLLTNPEAKSSEKAKETINEIYQKILQGESFEELAKQFSEDKSTADKGGLLQRFSSGQLTSTEFEDVAFGLNEKDQISQPFQTQFGWHIIKLVDKFPVKSFDELKPEFENRIKRDERSILITNSIAKKLHSKYETKKDAKLYAQLSKLVTADFYDQKWTKPEDFKNATSTLLTINKDRKFEADKFLTFIESQQKNGNKTRPISLLVDELYSKWVDDQLITYYNDNLENEFPEFKYVMEEYRDGLLLFDLMEKEIWEKAKTDTLGLDNFYQKHLNNYKWKKRFDIDIFSSTDEKAINKVQSYIKKGKSIDYIKEKLNAKGKVNIMVKSGLFEADFDILPELNPTAEGVTKITKKGEYYFVGNVHNIKPETPKTMEECKGKLISDYQQYLESNWVSDLKQDFNVKINQDVFDQVKANMKSL